MPGSLGHEEQDAKTFASWVLLCMLGLHYTHIFFLKKKNTILNHGDYFF